MNDLANADAFLADVVSAGDDPQTWVVQPLLTEFDGEDMEQIKVSSGEITPSVGDTVLILTMRNNLDFEKISRYYTASASNGIIIKIIKTSANPQYVLTGNYKFVGDLQITGKLDVSGNTNVDGTLTVAGKNINTHTHGTGGPNGTLSNGGGPVTGITAGMT